MPSRVVGGDGMRGDEIALSMTVKERIREMAIILLWGLVCWLFFQFFYSYHFFYQEQNQLFLFSGDYLVTYFQKPAWAACMAGDFLTQFYYYRFASRPC